MPVCADLLDALGVTLLLSALYTGLPALCHAACCGRRPNRETLWLTTGILLSFQALFGTLITRIAPGLSPAWNLVLFLPFALIATRLASRSPGPTSSTDHWFLPILLLAFVVRILAPLQHLALGQSDAYSHLQFLRDMVTTGQLRHGIYPPGHARVSAPALWISSFDLYTFARYAGAAYGVGMVAAIHVLTHRLHSRSAARTAALLAAAFPPFAPLLRTGVGLYANQLGLLLIVFLLWSLTLLAEEHPPRRLYLLLTLFAAALLISVPMMLLDLLPLLALLLLLRIPARISLPAATLLLLLTLLFLNRIPLETLQRTANIFTRQDNTAESVLPVLQQLAEDYLHWKSPPASIPQRVGIGLLALLAATAALLLHKSRPRFIPLLLLTALSGLQASTGILQFSSYQRAGWIFLICLCVLGGVLGAVLAHKLTQRAPRLQGTAIPLILICLLSLKFPPHPAPHLSPGEEEIIRLLVTLRTENQTCEFQPALHLWSRAFTRFDGAQGDPLYALLEDRPCIRIRRILPDTPLPPPHKGKHLFLIDSGDTPHTADPVFNREREKLLQINQRILNQIRELEQQPGVQLTARPLSPNLTLWEAQRSQPDR